MRVIVHVCTVLPTGIRSCIVQYVCSLQCVTCASIVVSAILKVLLVTRAAGMCVCWLVRLTFPQCEAARLLC